MTEQNAAVVRITSPAAVAFSKEKFEWTIESVDKLTGEVLPNAEQRAAFLVVEKGKPPIKGQAKITAQDRVLIYGLKEGRIRVTAALAAGRGCKETYEAFVREQLNMPFRVQLLEGKTEGIGTNLIWESKGAKFIRRADEKALASAENQIRIANIYLRQVCVRLRPDSDQTFDPNNRKNGEIRLLAKDKPGFFGAKVNDRLADRVSVGANSIVVNDRDGVLQIAYVNIIESLTDENRVTNRPSSR